MSTTQRPFRWPVAVERRIEAGAKGVWDAISKPGNLEDCHPFCAANPVMSWPGAQSVDEVHYLNGVVFTCRFTRWRDGVGYDLEITSRRGEVSFVSWTITPIDELSCSLRITVSPYMVQRVPVVLRWLPHLAIVRPRLRSYLSSVVRGFEWHVTKKEPVPRNQFGTHSWFS